MKLLVDPGALHVAILEIEEATDIEIWGRARDEQATTVTKDSDFLHRSLLFGHPPKVIRRALGNCSTAAVENALRSRFTDIGLFLADDVASYLIIE